MANIDKKFVKFYNQNKRKLFSYVYFKVKDDQVAYDITSNVFVKLYKKAKKDKDIFKYALAWCYKVALNEVIDYVRSSYYNKVKLESDTNNQNSKEDKTNLDKPLMIKEYDFADALQKDADYHIILEALNKLNQADREVITFRLLEELPFKDISVIFDITEAAAKMRYKRALQKLKELIKMQENKKDE